MLQLSKPGLPWELYTDLAQEYGDVVYMTAPGTSIMILSSLPIITELIERRSSKYSDRFQTPAFDLIKIGWNMGLLPYGPVWRAHRREFLQLMNAKAVLQYRPIVRRHTVQYLRGLLNDSANIGERTHRLFASCKWLTGLRMKSISRT